MIFAACRTIHMSVQSCQMKDLHQMRQHTSEETLTQAFKRGFLVALYMCKIEGWFLACPFASEPCPARTDWALCKDTLARWGAHGSPCSSFCHIMRLYGGQDHHLWSTFDHWFQAAWHVWATLDHGHEWVGRSHGCNLEGRRELQPVDHTDNVSGGSRQELFHPTNTFLIYPK